MKRLAPLALAAALAGCPLPQPLPDYPAGAVTPPRILVDAIAVAGLPSSSRGVVLVPAGCPAGSEPRYPLTATVYDTNTIESIEARWFVNYHPAYQQYYDDVRMDAVPANPDPLVLTRVVPPDDPDTGAPRPFAFEPYQYAPPLGAPPAGSPPYSGANILRVVELVVSNGFDPDAAAPPAPLPLRTPLPGFETQVYRWVFLSVPETPGACAPTDPVCVKCPSP